MTFPGTLKQYIDTYKDFADEKFYDDDFQNICEDSFVFNLAPCSQEVKLYLMNYQTLTDKILLFGEFQNIRFEY